VPGLGATAASITAGMKRGAELVFLLLENRLELVSLELQEQKLELVRLIVRALLAVQLSMLALVLACLSVVLLAPAQWQGLTVLVTTGVVALLALAAVLLLMRSARRMGKPLARTIEELRRDRELL